MEYYVCALDGYFWYPIWQEEAKLIGAARNSAAPSLTWLFRPLKRDIWLFVSACARRLLSASWRRYTLGSIWRSWSRGGITPCIWHTVSHPAGKPEQFPTPCPAAAPLPGITSTAENRKCSGHRHIPPHHPALGSCRNHNRGTHVPAAAPASIADNP